VLSFKCCLLQGVQNDSHPDYDSVNYRVHLLRSDRQMNESELTLLKSMAETILRQTEILNAAFQKATEFPDNPVIVSEYKTQKATLESLRDRYARLLERSHGGNND